MSIYFCTSLSRLSFEGRGIDTAWNYNQQVVVGWAINNASQQVRDELFITTKIPCVASAAAALQYIEQDLQQLNVTSVDLVSPYKAPGPPMRMFLKYAYRAHPRVLVQHAYRVHRCEYVRTGRVPRPPM